MKHLKVTSVLLSATMLVSMVMTPVSVFADETEASSETAATERVEETEKKEEKEAEKKPASKAEEETTPAPSATEKQEEPESSEPEETTKEEPAETDKKETASDEDKAQEPKENEEQAAKDPVAVDEPETEEETKDAMDAIASGKCGKNVKWTFDSAGTLKISGSGAMSNYIVENDIYDPSSNKDTRPWKSYVSQIEKVVISKGVTSVGSYAFFECKNLTNVSLPDSLKAINEEAFASCPFTDFSIPKSVTTIGASAFYYCKSLKSITIPKSVTVIGAFAFKDCHSLESINIPSGVIRIQEYTFCNCESLTTITIPASVTVIGNSAFSLSGLESINIPSGVKIIQESAFELCHSLNSINIPASVTEIGASAFLNCTSLRDVSIAVSGLRTIGKEAFKHCTKLPYIEIPLSVLEVGDSAFERAENLETVTCSLTLYSMLEKSKDDVFINCPKLNLTYRQEAALFDPIEVNGVGYIVTDPDIDGTGTVTAVALLNADMETVSVPSVVQDSDVTYKVTRIGPDVFRNNTALKKVVIGSNVLIIDNLAFQGCKNLVSVTGGARLKTIGAKAFISCPKLKVFSITSSALSKIGPYAFYGDKSLKTLQVKKTTKLTKSGVKKSLKGSSVKTVKVKKSKVKKFKKYFTKKNCGKKVKVKK